MKSWMRWRTGCCRRLPSALLWASASARSIRFFCMGGRRVAGEGPRYRPTTRSPRGTGSRRARLLPCPHLAVSPSCRVPILHCQVRSSSRAAGTEPRRTKALGARLRQRSRSRSEGYVAANAFAVRSPIARSGPASASKGPRAGSWRQAPGASRSRVAALPHTPRPKPGKPEERRSPRRRQGPAGSGAGHDAPRRRSEALLGGSGAEWDPGRGSVSWSVVRPGRAAGRLRRPGRRVVRCLAP